jgi:hypothetical protein
MELYLNHAVKGPRLAGDMTATMGAVGLPLAIAGLYGLVAYNVSRRTREIGIRTALGALSSDVLRLMMGKGLVLVGIGTAVGLATGVRRRATHEFHVRFHRHRHRGFTSSWCPRCFW